MGQFQSDCFLKHNLKGQYPNYMYIYSTNQESKWQHTFASSFSLYFLYWTGSESGIGLAGTLVGVCVGSWPSDWWCGVDEPLPGVFFPGGPGVVFPLGSGLAGWKKKYTQFTDYVHFILYVKHLRLPERKKKVLQGKLSSHCF